MNVRRYNKNVGEYEGWKNRATWNVALWINNEEPLYRTAVEYVKRRKDAGRTPSWNGFVQYAGLAYDRTPDGYAYGSARLDRKALTEMLKEMVD